MNLSAPFVRRPVATTLLTIGATLIGIVAFQFLPVASLPQVEFPTVNVSASLPGASPETMATSVAAWPTSAARRKVRPKGKQAAAMNLRE